MTRNELKTTDKGKLYFIWKGMLDKCYNEKSALYKAVGGKGAIVCSEWRDSFEEFFEWAIGNGYRRGLFIKRKHSKNGGHYSPENCIVTRAKTMEERFFEKIDKNGPNGCWIWTGARSSDGYGSFNVDRKTYGTHRLSWIIHKGPIPEGMLICHICDVVSCVNPDHFFLGTNLDNKRDSMKKGRHVASWVKGMRAPTAKFSNEEVTKIREEMKNGANVKDMAVKYGVAFGTMNNIKSGHRYKNALIASEQGS